MIVRAVILSCVVCAGASAQVVYEPVRIQYGGAQPYFYAGDDVRIHDAAAFPYSPGTSWGRVDGFAFANDRRAVSQRFARTFTDAFGVRDARPFGLTIDQVWNEANARLPRFFRKSQNRVATEPAQAVEQRPRGTIEIKRYRPRTAG